MGVDRKFLKSKNLLEAHKHFLRLCEWSYVPTTLEEEGEDENQQPQENDPMTQQGQDPNMNNGGQGGMDNAMPQGGDMNDDGMDAQDPNSMSDDQNMGMEQDPNAMPPMGDEEMNPMSDDMMDDSMEDEVEDEEVIDVEDLTNAQEKVNDKVNHVGKDLGEVDDKIKALFDVLSKMETMIQNNNQEIARFKAEFEHRNPTPTEKLNLRALDSYPYNVRPEEYWSQKAKDPRNPYNVYADNDQPTTDEYEITNNDVDDFNDREIEKSFDVTDDMQIDLKKIFGL